MFSLPPGPKRDQIISPVQLTILFAQLLLAKASGFALKAKPIPKM
jgi:hypothetical protein